VIALSGNEALTEQGEYLTVDEVTAQLLKMPSTLFATTEGPDLLSYWDSIFAVSHPGTWQWRTSEHRQSHSKRQTYRVTVAVHWFGFQAAHGKTSGYHRLIDPVTMYQKKLSSVCPGDDPEIIRLLRWAVVLRDFCAENNLQVRPTIGGVSSQLLTDPRFYPRPRRKVPAKTNERARDNLPGNHYHLSLHPSPSRSYDMYYLDQHRAHHYHAQRIRFPHADHLYAYGYFRNLTSFYREQPVPNFMGLYCLDLQIPARGKAYSWIQGRGTVTHQFVHTNELPHLLDMGYRVLGVRAAWGSHHRDTGLNKLAAWACQQLDRYNDARWLKPLLLSTYGTLACRPTYAEAVFKQARRGKPVTVLTGRRSLTGLQVQRPVKLEPGIANVLQRGMIEAATRSESVGMAQYLETQLQHVLQIYADAVIVELDEDRPLPPLPDPWELKHQCNRYQPINRQAFIADGMTRLPGVGHHELHAYRKQRQVVEQLP
jgi:hypothetical protein